MEQKNEMMITFDSRSSNESFARVAVAAFTTQLNPTLEEVADIKTAVSEAITNAIIHGYEEDETKFVHMRCELIENTIKVVVEDYGKGIEDIELAKKPLYTTKANLERSGMGFTIMESFMDELKVESIPDMGTKVTMRKYIMTAREDKNEVEDIEKVSK